MHIWGNNSWANRKPRDSSKNVRFLCYEGFSIFSNNFKGNKNVTLANISKSKNVINNRRHGFILLLILTSWSKKQLKNFVDFWCWSWKVVTKCTKCNENFTLLDKMPKLWFINQFIVFSHYLYREIKKKF